MNQEEVIAGQPTPYPDVNAILALLLRDLRAILGAEFVGLYLYGSLSLGDFDPGSSDVAFLVVTRDALPQETLDALQAMHAQIAESDLVYARKLEGWYFSRAALRRHDPAGAPQATIGADWDFGLAQPGSIWVIERQIVREHGLVVVGPSPRDLIDPLHPDDIRAAVRDQLRTFWAHQLHGPEWLRPRAYQAFAILTMCRALHALATGQVVSKPVAVAWAQATLDEPWPALIAQALAWRQDHRPDDMTAMLGFVRWTVERAENGV